MPGPVPVSYTHLDVYKRQVLQVKRTEAKGKALIGMMRQEQKRIRPGTCDRYILVIASRTLRDELKEEIRKMIPEIRDTGDIVTGIDSVSYTHLDVYKRQALFTAKMNGKSTFAQYDSGMKEVRPELADPEKTS